MHGNGRGWYCIPPWTPTDLQLSPLDSPFNFMSECCILFVHQCSLMLLPSNITRTLWTCFSRKLIFQFFQERAYLGEAWTYRPGTGLIRVVLFSSRIAEATIFEFFILRYLFSRSVTNTYYLSTSESAISRYSMPYQRRAIVKRCW